MNKKALYEAIMKDISKIVKKKINENMEENTINIPSKYYDEDGDIDLSDLSVLPQNIINALAKDLLTNGDFQEDDRDDDCLMCSILPYIDSENKNTSDIVISSKDFPIDTTATLSSFEALSTTCFASDLVLRDYDEYKIPAGYHLPIMNLQEFSTAYCEIASKHAFSNMHSFSLIFPSFKTSATQVFVHILL